MGIVKFVTEHWDTIVEVIGSASVLAAIFAKITKNKTDDRIVAWVQRLLDLAAINPARRAELAGDKAVEANPAPGVGSVVGDTLDVE